MFFTDATKATQANGWRDATAGLKRCSGCEGGCDDGKDYAPTATDLLAMLRRLLVNAVGQDSLSDAEIMGAVDAIDSAQGGTFSYQDRARLERGNLLHRINTLETLFGMGKFATINQSEQTRLRSQLKAMQTYAHILHVRICNFSEEG